MNARTADLIVSDGTVYGVLAEVGERTLVTRSRVAVGANGRHSVSLAKRPT